MPKPLLVLRAVVASPSDVKPERDALPAIFEEVNHDTAGPARLHLELSRWETDSYPGFHPEGPQGLIDPLLNIQDCDLLIGILWSKLGTPTPDGRTGTEHEFHTAIGGYNRNRRPQIMAYFCERPVAEHADPAQVALVERFRESFPAKGLYWPYSSVSDFQKLVATHLRNYLRDQIQTIWGEDPIQLRRLDEERASHPPTTAILGRLNVRTPHDRPVIDADSKLGLQRIGVELAKAGWQLMVYDSADEYVSTEVVRGYVESGEARSRSIRIRRPLTLDQQPFPAQRDRPELFWDDPIAQDQWEVAFIPSIADADGVVLAGNGQFTLLGGLQAVGARMPMVALAGHGGITADVWGVLKGQRLRLTSDEELARMAARESSPEWAHACVKALIDQKQRNDVRRIWRT
jgi:hypothetical protein